MSQLTASRLPLFKKQEYLRAFSEDDFRDQVLRPLFLRKGLTDGRDYCGPTEEGKDCLFIRGVRAAPSKR